MTADKSTLNTLETGRPPKDPTKEKYYDTALHALLVVKLKDVEGIVRGGRIDTNAMAAACGVVRFTVYRWFDAAILPSAAANKLLKLSEGSLTVEDVTPFMFD